MSSKLFDQLASVWERDKSITTKTKPDSVFMTNRFLSLDLDGFLAASDCNRMKNLPEWATLPFLKYATPERSSPYNKYPKKLVGPKLSDKKKVTLQRICTRFNVEEFHGMQIVKLLELQGFKLDAS